jgi:hypothetical protein
MHSMRKVYIYFVICKLVCTLTHFPYIGLWETILAPCVVFVISAFFDRKCGLHIYRSYFIFI